MRQSETIDVKGVGPVYFERSMRATRLNISIRPPDKVRVGVPESVTLEKAMFFVRCHIEWIQKHLDKMKRDVTQQDQSSDNVNTSEAEEKIVNRVYEFAGQYGIVFNKLTIRSQKTKWGSCSNKNNISLNIKLAKLPQELMDYVILHELVHIRIKNHSREFWAELEQYIPDAKQKDSRLNKYHLRLL